MDDLEKRDESQPEWTDIHGPGELLAHLLLEEKLIRYTDDRFQVSSGECRFILRLIREKDKCTVFYAQVPYVYPLPDDLQSSIVENLESVLKTKMTVDFINAGTEAKRKDLQNMASFIGD